MSNPFLGKAKSTGASKMAHTSGSAKNYEDSRDTAKRRYGKGYSEGGEVEATPLPASPFEDVKPTRSPRLPRKPVTPPPNRL